MLAKLRIMPSTVISKFFYNEDSRILKIVFMSGIVYEYKNVPANVYQAMKTSGSKGIYFNQHIKGRYEFERVE
jgi:KTSC domain-containing protein